MLEGAAAGPCVCPPARPPALAGPGSRLPPAFPLWPGAGGAAGAPQGFPGVGAGLVPRSEAACYRFLRLPGRRVGSQGGLRLLISRGERGVLALPLAPAASCPVTRGLLRAAGAGGCRWHLRPPGQCRFAAAACCSRVEPGTLLAVCVGINGFV